MTQPAEEIAKGAGPEEMRRHFLDLVGTYLPETDRRGVRKALETAEELLRNQVRASGQPFSAHALGIGITLAELKMDRAGLEAGLLLPARERGLLTDQDVRLPGRFSAQTPDLMEAVARISRFSFRRGVLSNPESFRKLILTLAKDLRVILIKLADRLDSMRTIQALEQPEQASIAQETMDIYAPLANRLGLYKIKRELEDLSFRCLQPEKYQTLKALVAKKQSARQELIRQTMDEVKAILHDNGIEGEVSGRGKHFWSIQMKMDKRGLPFEELFDLAALRIIVDTIAQCYQVLGLVHHKWRPIPGTFDDYIAVPKPNGYQSLHTALIGPGNERVEIQIRTRHMHEIAENGVAAHWMYKETSRSSLDAERLRQFGWLHEMLSSGAGVFDNSVLESLRTDLFDDQIFVFTPAGDVQELTAGSTPVDFAYAVHTSVGDRCVGAKVNGRIAPLSDGLKNGDIVEIITNPRTRPSADWLEFVRTARARQKIRYALTEERRAQERVRGREQVERCARERGVPNRSLKDEARLLRAFEKFHCRSADELNLLVGRGELTPAQVLDAMCPEVVPPPAPPPAPAPEGEAPAPARPARHPSTIVVAGQDDMLVRYAHCCRPLMGDAIVGFVTRGRGVTIHRRDCPRLDREEAGRLLPAEWASSSREVFPVKIRLMAERHAVYAEASVLLKKMDIPVESGHVQPVGNGFLMEYVVPVHSAEEARTVMEKLRSLRGVVEVSRAGGG